jgi:hypothetical protein
MDISIKSFLIDEDFRKDAPLWSSKFYRLINVVMRNNPIEEILKSTKYARRYIIKMVRYFFKYGLYQGWLRNFVSALPTRASISVVGAKAISHPSLVCIKRI